MSLHLVIDGRYAHPHLSGIGRYALNLARGLGAIAGPEDLRVTVLGPDPSTAHPVSGPLADVMAGRVPGVRGHPLGGSPRNPAHLPRLARALRDLQADLFHAPDAFAPFSVFGHAPCPVVLTIHDLIPLAMAAGAIPGPPLPPAPPGLKVRLAPLWKRWQQLQCRQARAVLTVSNHSANDLHQYLGLPTEKVHVIYPGVETPEARSPSPPGAPGPAEVPELLRRFGLTGDYLLYVGRRDPYKDVPSCVRLLAALRPRHPALRLVLAGHADPRFPDAERERDRLGLGTAVLTTGHLTDTEIDTLYRHARATLLLSRYEGFGYPVAESFARGTPVICTRLTSLPEVAGDAALYLPPTSETPDPDSPPLAPIHRLLTDPDFRTHLTTTGARQVRPFTIETQTRQTLALYRHLPKGGRESFSGYH